MAQFNVNEKRTRSQLTLPDDILQLSQGSPLKDARTALRNHATIVGDSSLDIDSGGAAGTDDELLLSPRKTNRGTRVKRGASPPPQGEYPSRSGSPPDGRELKRVKRDVNPFSNRAAPTHARNFSEPNAVKRLKETRKRAATASGSKKPHSSSSAEARSPPIIPADKGRARSVPLFPSSFSVPHLDLKNPPPSPTRARSRSRSPSKEREPKLRITSGPIMASRTLESIPDETNTEMDIDSGEVRPTVPEGSSHLHTDKLNIDAPNTSIIVITTEPSTSPMNTASVPQATEPSAATNASHTTLHILPHEPPSTPAPSHLTMLSLPMSPLTPLPETPHPSKFSTMAKGRYTGVGWGTYLEEEAENDKGPTLQPTELLPALTILGNSHLPHPSSIANLHSALVDPADQPLLNTHPKHATLMDPPGVAVSIKSTPSETTKPLPSTSKPNAFTMLMAQARTDKVAEKPEKGKGKAVAGVSKAGLSSSATVLPIGGGFSSSKAQVQKAKAKGKEKEEVNPRVSLKMKMRPREKTKPKLFPVLVPLPTTERGIEVEERRSTSPESVSPAPTIPETRPPTTSHTPMIILAESTPMDPIMEAAVKLGSSGPPPVVDRASELPTPLTHPEPDVVAPESDAVMPDSDKGLSPMSDSVSEFLANIVPDVATPAPTENKQLTEPTIDVSNAETPAAAVPAVDTLARPPNQEPAANSTATVSKLPLRKKKVPATVVAASRVTRSVSLRRKENGGPSSNLASRRGTMTTVPGLVHKKSVPSVVPVAAEKTPCTVPVTVEERPPDTEASTSSLPDLPTDPEVPTSPVRRSSPVRKPGSARTTRDALSKTPSRFHIRSGPASSPSPTKLVRASSMYSARPTASLGRTLTGGSTSSNFGPSSLSTLASALEKLTMPPPSRPNTSMGFNRDDDDSDHSFEQPQSHDDSAIGRSTKGVLGRVDVTNGDVQAGGSSSRSPPGGSSTSKSGVQGVRPHMLQQPLPAFMSGKAGFVAAGAGRLLAGNGSVMRGGKSTVPGNKARIFGVGGGGFTMGSARARPLKASWKISLPSVMASPVKGAVDGGDDAPNEPDRVDGAERNDASSATADNDVFTDTSPNMGSFEPLLGSADTGKGKKREKEKSAATWKRDASRRASMASHALSQSLNSLPQTIMGPPELPCPGRVGRSASSTYPLAGVGFSTTSPTDNLGMSTRSAMGARSAPGALGKIRGGVGGHVSSSKKTQGISSQSAPESLRFLKDCVIFVDVRTDDGDEAGSLFIEMLEGLGARILSRVGQTCTHIVFKNGLMSTVTRYRLLRDPKPLVVGIRWVVECVEQRTQVDESNFLVDPDDINVAGTAKRRRSMLPKLISREHDDVNPSDLEKDRAGGDGDQSMDGSNSSIDDLPPLEKARRRKSMLVGPPL